jgi:alpha-L-rhamnosidase
MLIAAGFVATPGTPSAERSPAPLSVTSLVTPGGSTQSAPHLTSIRTVRGRASVDWARSGAGLRLTVEVPVGAEAEVHVPATRRSDAPQGADFVRSEPGYVVYSVPHGNWEFTATALTG